MSGVTTLDRLRLRDTGRIVSLDGREDLLQRLMALGFLPGARLEVVQVAPFGDPITIALDGWRISLRLGDAASIAVEPANGRTSSRTEVP
ncbi:MAG: ferrous iron transport protein A [Planctomycetes bacterium]|nr:ferrous iron transport protein A [Planctomycetota bacterium]